MWQRVTHDQRIFLREENYSKQHINWKSRLKKSEVENASIGSSVEPLLMSDQNKLMKFPDDTKIFRDTNVWIGDTAATYDVTFSKSGMTNAETSKYSSVVVAYNGENYEP